MLVGGDYEGAEKMFRLVVDGYAGCDLERDACFKLGSTYYLTQKYDASALYYGLAALSTKASLARDALFNYSLALEQAGDFGRAAEASRRLAVRFPFSDQFERSLVRAGYCLQSAGRPMEAMRFYDGVLQYTGEAETLAETHYWIAECFSDAGDHVRAACEFLRTAYLYPKQGQWSGTASYGAGEECEKAGLAEEAIIIYKQNVRTYGKSSDWGKASADRLADLGGRREPGEKPEVKPAKGE
jgi:TolA-binding protein